MQLMVLIPALFTRGVMLTMLVSGTPACDVPAWQRAFKEYVRAYPKAEGADLYKFAHQGILGSEHAVSDTASVRAWMQREVGGLPTHPEPPTRRASLVEALPPDGRFVRVHLRPYIARGGSPETLLRAFVATANGERGDTAQFACAERGVSAATTGQLERRTLALFRERRRAGFAAVHHSAGFEAAYVPAYRVVRSSMVESWLRAEMGSAVRPD